MIKPVYDVIKLILYLLRSSRKCIIVNHIDKLLLIQKIVVVWDISQDLYEKRCLSLIRDRH